MHRVMFAFVLAAMAPSASLGQSLKSIAILKIEPNEHGMQMVFSPDGRYLAIERLGRDDKATITVWDIAAKKTVGTMGSEERFEGLAVISQPVRIAATSTSGRGKEGIRLFELDSPTGRFEQSGQPVPSDLYGRMAFSVDGKRLGFSDQKFTLIDVENRKMLHSFSPRINIGGSAMSPDLCLFAASNFQDVDLYDAETGKDRGSLMDHCGNVDSIAFRPDGKIIAVGASRSDGRYRKTVSEIKLWDVAQLKQTATTKEFPGHIWSVIHPDERVIFAEWSADLNSPRELRLYNVRTGRWTTALKFESRRGNVFACSVGVVAVARAEAVEVWRIVPPE